MTYFDRPEISVSDIKKFLSNVGEGHVLQSPNIQAIYAMGTTFHETILEPHKIDETHKDDDRILATKMKVTFYKDPMCRDFILAKDFEREKEIYGEVTVGGMTYISRCKADGIRPGIKTILELKGLSVTNKKAFEMAIDELNYDMAAVHYLLTSKCERMIIVGISKKKPDLMFKRIIKKHDETYLMGEEKLIQALRLLRKYSPEDVKLVA